jgi:hypothetical protein
VKGKIVTNINKPVVINNLVEILTLKRRKERGVVKIDEIENSLKLWVKYEQEIFSSEKKFNNKKHQLDLFKDAAGIYRLKGRLEGAHLSFDTKHPMLLNHVSYFTKLVIINAHHTVKHMRGKSALHSGYSFLSYV